MKIPDHIRQAFKVKGLPSRKINDGYYLVLCPSWYTGISIGNYVHEHVLVYCKEHRLTRVPEGYVIHHIDFNKLNNEPSNLQMMTNLEHSILHNPSKAKSD